MRLQTVYRMDKEWKEKLRKVRDLEIVFQVPLSKHTTLRVGGNVSCIAYPKTKLALSNALKVINSYRVPYFVLGKGSNLLVADRLPEMVAISIELGSTGIRKELFGKDVFLHLGGGISVSHLMSFCVKEGISGLEFLVGIPGTVGGAVTMNAGTRLGEVADVFEGAVLITKEGKEQNVLKSDIAFSYRRASLPEGAIIWEAVLKGRVSKKEEVRKHMRNIVKDRKLREPEAWGCAGSIFRNPPGDFAGRLVEQAGLKGVRIGNAEVCEKHANWIVTRENATAQDVFDLMLLVQRKVREQFGIVLEPEVRLIGFGRG